MVGRWDEADGREGEVKVRVVSAEIEGSDSTGEESETEGEHN